MKKETWRSASSPGDHRGPAPSRFDGRVYTSSPSSPTSVLRTDARDRESQPITVPLAGGTTRQSRAAISVRTRPRVAGRKDDRLFEQDSTENLEKYGEDNWPARSSSPLPTMALSPRLTTGFPQSSTPACLRAGKLDRVRVLEGPDAGTDICIVPTTGGTARL